MICSFAVPEYIKFVQLRFFYVESYFKSLNPEVHMVSLLLRWLLLGEVFLIPYMRQHSPTLIPQLDLFLFLPIIINLLCLALFESNLRD